MNKQKTEKLRGVVRMKQAQESFSLNRYFPSERLQHFIEHYWLISWQLPDGVEHKQHVISHPAVNLTFIQNNSTITGIVTKRFEHILRGSGNLIGVRFTPAGFYSFANAKNTKMIDITDSIFKIEQFFNLNTHQFERDILAFEKPAQKTQMLENQLFASIPKLDKNVSTINQMIKQIEANKSILKVSDICQKFDLEERQLQRLFNKYIGVSAKWIINRYRIHEALDTIETNQTINWSNLALSLGYYDQAHFINDFKNLVGQSPNEYLRTLNSSN